MIDWNKQLIHLSKEKQEESKEQLIEMFLPLAESDDDGPRALLDTTGMDFEEHPSHIRNQVKAFELAIRRGSWGAAWSMYNSIEVYTSKVLGVKKQKKWPK